MNVVLHFRKGIGMGVEHGAAIVEGSGISSQVDVHDADEAIAVKPPKGRIGVDVGNIEVGGARG